MFSQFLFYYHTLKARRKNKAIYMMGVDNYYSEERKYAGGRILPVDLYQSEISKLIDSDGAIMVARFGSTELLSMSVFDFKIFWKYEAIVKQMQEYSGFFPDTNAAVKRFSREMHSAMPEVDIMATWNLDMEEYYIKKYMRKDMAMSRLRFLEPWYSTNPWTKSLAGKKVLVIHPFSNTIEQQYERRKKLFKNQDILPEFELHTVKAVQTIAGQKDARFETWFDALDYMEHEALKQEFDIALIGCGAYGFPLAARLKRAGKKAIHMGGVLQILFGIKGGRWDNDPTVKALYNDYWVRPLDSDRPKNAEIVEGGCYW